MPRKKKYPRLTYPELKALLEEIMDRSIVDFNAIGQLERLGSNLCIFIENRIILEKGFIGEDFDLFEERGEMPYGLLIAVQNLNGTLRRHVKEIQKSSK